jgi:hypothetical protein
MINSIKNSKFIIFIFCISFQVFSVYSVAKNIPAVKKNYLSQPTGEYGVGFQDFHWINTNICPDPNYNGKNKNDFSPKNKKLCHEIMVRIYYPMVTQAKPRAPYYKPLIQNIKNDLAHLPGVSKKNLRQINHLKSFSVEKSPIILGKKFPVIFFSPGLGSQTEMYENFLIELVSHGYIVIGINSPFINGDIELPNKHIIKFNPDESLKELYKISLNDFSYTYKKIHVLNKSTTLFSAMDLQHIGALGQSLGGEIVAKAAHSCPGWFQAAATLDSGIDKYDDTLKKLTIPFMRIISANRVLEQPLIPAKFELENNGFLVVISPNKKVHDFSYHMNFTDYSTLQYLPAEQVALAYFKQEKKKPLFGKGNGWEITHSINIYLLKFFKIYLKNDISLELKNCSVLSKNTFIKCGGGD